MSPAIGRRKKSAKSAVKGGFPASDAQYRLALSGGFRLSAPDGVEVHLSSRRSRALLAILALLPERTVLRPRLRFLLWDDRGEQQAADSLRQQLVQLRRELGTAADRLLITRDDQVSLTAGLAIDVADIMVGDLSSYHGPLLDGLEVDSGGFE